ncbi:MAG: arsenic efflux protein [Lachnospiraceae bacterium]|nr:arsenic efflux protein [Lachnospiraceae bacterium]
MTDIVLDALLDALKILPFLFFAFLVMEAMEHYSSHRTGRWFAKGQKAGPLLGALLGLIPQCGFSVAAANLYAGGVISLGTLLAVFLSTSDEAILIFLGHPGQGALIGKVLLAKLVIGVLAGYGVDIFVRERGEKKEISDLCHSCGCHDAKGILRPALRHTVRIFVWLFLITLGLNLALELLGAERLAVFLGRDSLVQPFFTALLGLIPNCAASVLLAELYLAGGIGFGAAVAGLCSGAGLGLVVLFRMNRDKKSSLQILLLLYGIAVLSGLVLQLGGF